METLYSRYYTHPFHPYHSDKPFIRRIKRILWYFCPIFYRYNLEFYYKSKELCKKHRFEYHSKGFYIWEMLKYPIREPIKLCFKRLWWKLHNRKTINHFKILRESIDLEDDSDFENNSGNIWIPLVK